MTSNAEFEDYRGLLFAIAYRMLGTAMEAEDIVQEAFLRFQSTPRETIQSPQAFLRTITTRLCLDHLKSAKVQRETYIGPWLPEPILTAQQSDMLNPSQSLSQKESISMAFLVMLERLTPIERAVFILREVFDYGYDEIAEIVDKSETACRKVLSRAKQHVQNNQPRYESTPAKHQELLTAFVHALGEGKVEDLTNMLAKDVTMWADGGGQISAATRPLVGYEAVMKFFMGLWRLAPGAGGIDLVIAEVNGQPAMIALDAQGIMFVIDAESDGERILNIRSVRNPEKLARLNQEYQADKAELITRL